MDVDIQTLLLLFAFLSFASLVHGSFGFGFPLVSTPLIAIIWNVKYAILITLFPTIMINIVNIIHGGSSIQLIKEYWVYPFFIFIGAYIGSIILITYDAEPFRLLMAIMIILYLFLRLQSKFKFRDDLFANKWIAIPFFGILGGFIVGTVNVMLAVVLIYLSGICMPKKSQIQFMNLSFLYGKISQVIFYGFRPDILNSTVMSSASVLLCIPGLMLGFYLRRKIDPVLYQKILYIFLVFVSLYLTYQFIEYAISAGQPNTKI